MLLYRIHERQGISEVIPNLPHALSFEKLIDALVFRNFCDALPRIGSRVEFGKKEEAAEAVHVRE